MASTSNIYYTQVDGIEQDVRPGSAALANPVISRKLGFKTLATPTAAQGYMYLDSGLLVPAMGMGASATPLNVALAGTCYAQTASSTAVGASATNSSLFAGPPSAVGTRTLPIGFLVVGRTMRVRFGGILTTSATLTNNLLTLKLNLVSSTPTTVQLAISPATQVPISQTNATFYGEVTFTCRSVGASGTVFAQGYVVIGNATVTVNAWVIQMNAAAVATIDTTKTEQIDLTATTGAGVSALTLTNCTIEVAD
jgi:hypothetical protein